MSNNISYLMPHLLGNRQPTSSELQVLNCYSSELLVLNCKFLTASSELQVLRCSVPQIRLLPKSYTPLLHQLLKTDLFHRGWTGSASK